jgi:hypothetical protein
MGEKVERSRVQARVALDAYRSTGNHDEDDLAAIGDLIADLLHLAGSLADGRNGWTVRPAGLVERALTHYDYEADPVNRAEEV